MVGPGFTVIEVWAFHVFFVVAAGAYAAYLIRYYGAGIKIAEAGSFLLGVFTAGAV